MRKGLGLSRINTTTSPISPPLDADIRNKCRLDLNQFAQEESLGSGTQSIVSRVVRRSDGKNFALKTLKLEEPDVGNIQDVINEIYDLDTLRQQNITRVYSCFYSRSERHMYILMEYVDGASLEDYLKFTPQIPEPALGRLVYWVIQGLSYLKRTRFIHRDLKPSNILLSKTAQVKIADFGLAKHLRDSYEQRCTYIGAIPYMSPERLKKMEYSYPSDIWSLGVIAYQCALGHFPYPGNSDKFTEWELEQYFQGEIKVELPPGYSEGFRRFIISCLKVDPAQRATVEELQQNEWVLQFQDSPANQSGSDQNPNPLLDWILEADKKKNDQIKSLASLKTLGIAPGPH